MSENTENFTDRVEHDGHWALLDARALTWGQRRAARKAAMGDFWTDFAPVLVTCTVVDWSYDTDHTDPASWEAVDGQFGDLVFSKALDLWKQYQGAKADPTQGPSAS